MVHVYHVSDDAFKPCFWNNHQSSYFITLLMNGLTVDAGKVIQTSILNASRQVTTLSMPHSSLITELCAKAGVTWDETEEKIKSRQPIDVHERMIIRWNSTTKRKTEKPFQIPLSFNSTPIPFCRLQIQLENNRYCSLIKWEKVENQGCGGQQQLRGFPLPFHCPQSRMWGARGSDSLRALQAGTEASPWICFLTLVLLLCLPWC